MYRLARWRDCAGKDVLQVRVIKDRAGYLLMSEKSVLRRWKELSVVKNEREEGRWIKAGKSRSAEH